MINDPRVFEAICSQIEEEEIPSNMDLRSRRVFVRASLQYSHEALVQIAYNIDHRLQGVIGSLRRATNPHNFDGMASRRDGGALRPGNSNIRGHDDPVDPILMGVQVPVD
jgi:hypothetical protein